MTYPVRQLFLHFFDTHFFDDRVANNPKAITEARLATRLAVMLSERVFVPAASYVENSHCRAIIDEYADIFDDGAIVLVGGEETLRDYSTAKLLQYDEGTARHEAYLRSIDETATSPAFHSRSRDTTAEIGLGWTYRAANLGRIVRGLPDKAEIARVERTWTDIPKALQHRAFITDNVAPLLGINADHPAGRTLRSRVSHIINDEYFHSFVHELHAAVTTDLLFLDGFEPNPDIARLPYRPVRAALMQANLLEQVMSLQDAKAVRRLHEREDIVQPLLPIFDAMRETLLTPQQLELPIGTLRPAVERLTKIPTGKKHATRYAKAIQSIFTALFRYSLDTGQWEAPINEGRKRIDILFPNKATAGAFQWARMSYDAKFVVVECKNYREDPTNPEVDQLAGRMAPHRTKFGILAFRKANNFDRLLQRCIDVKRDQNALLVPLSDRDLQELADSTSDPGLDDLSQSLMGRRMLTISRA